MEHENRLRQLRKRVNLTQGELARKFNIERSTYSRYESGKTSPTVDLMTKLAEFYGVSIGFLMGREALIFSPKGGDTGELTDEESRLLEELKKEAAFYDFLDADEDKKREIIEGLKMIIRGGLYKRDDE